MDNYLYEDFNYWIGIPDVDSESVCRKELKPFLTILKEKYLDALKEIQNLAAKKAQLTLRNTFLESEIKRLKKLNEELTQENNSLTEEIYG